MSTTEQDIGTPKTRVPRLQVRNRTDPNDTDEPQTERWARTSRPTPSITSTTDRPSSDHSHTFWSPDSVPSMPSASISESAKPKSKRNVFKFLSLKEPSASAWEQFAQQQKAEAALRGNNAVGISYKKLPARVPKVNSKWDGMPRVASEEKSTPSSVKTSVDDHAWGTPTSSSRQSSSSKNAAHGDKSFTPQSSGSTLRAAHPQGHAYFDQPPHSLSTVSRAHGTSHGTMAWSTRSLTPEELGPAEWSTFSEMPTGRPHDEEPAVPGLSESLDTTDPALTSSMPIQVASADSSPAEPRTPEDEFDLNPSDDPKRAPPPAYSDQREPSSDLERAWPATGDAYSGYAPVHVTLPPLVPTRSARRASSNDSLLNARDPAAPGAIQRQLDGATSTPHQDRLTAIAQAFQRSSAVVKPLTREAPPPGAISIDDGEVDELDAVDVSRFRSGSTASQTAARPYLNFSRPSSAGRSSIDSLASTSSIPASPTASDITRTPFRSFSRPLPSNITALSSPERPTSASSSRSHKSKSSIGIPSIVRHNMPVYPTSSSVFVPPRFQPGRAIVKDSDLDTIAETDSLCSRRSYLSTLDTDDDVPAGRDVDTESNDRRTSYASTINADIPRRRAAVSDMDGASDDTFGDEFDSESLRASTDYTPSEGAADPYISAFPEYAVDAGHSMVHSVDAPSSSLDHNHQDDSGDDTETELDHASVRKHRLREEPSARSLAPTVASATSVLSARWSKTPQERLGLGGRVRKSTISLPWDEETYDAARCGSAASGATKKVVTDRMAAGALDGFDRGGEKMLTAGDMRTFLRMFKRV